MPSLMAMLGLDISALQAGGRRAVGAARQIGAEIGGALRSRVGMALAGIASYGALKAAAWNTIQWAGGIKDLSDKLDISTEAIQKWDYAMRQTGATMQDAEAFFVHLSASRKKALEGNEDLIRSFARLGVTLTDLRAKRLEDIASQIGRVIQKGDPQALIADLREIGGRGAQELIGAFKAGIDELGDELKKFGGMVDDEVISKLDEVGDKLKIIAAEFRGALAPATAKAAAALEKSWVYANEGVNAWVGYIQGGMQGASDLVQMYREERGRLEQQLRESRDRSKSAKRPTIDYEPEPKKEKPPKPEKPERQKYAGMSALEINQLQRIGAYAASPPVDYARESRDILKRIEENTKTLTRSDKSWRGVTF